MTERDLIQQIQKLTLQQGRGSVVQGIGDDCAVVTKDPKDVWLLTMDTLVESVHFDCSWHPPYLLGRKAVTVNVSDVAAMGGKPVFALLSLGLPADFEPAWATELNRGIHDACCQYGCLLIGGDTVCSPEKVSLTLTLIGEAAQDQVVYRHGACLGDTIWVSGVLGYAAAGLAWYQSSQTGQTGNIPPLITPIQSCQSCSPPEYPAEYPLELKPCLDAHLNPEARTGLGRALAQTGCVHAMMDISDGLATDLAHLCQQSKVGARVEAEKLPGRQGLACAADLLQKKTRDWMLAGGEDYELLFTASPQDSQIIQDVAAEQGIRVSPVGTITAQGQGVCDKEQQISFQGFDHFA